MDKTKHSSKNQKSSRPDVVKEYIDSNGKKLLLTVNFKTFNGRTDIASITVQTSDLTSPVTRRMLSEIPLDRLFRDELAVESKKLNGVLRSAKRTTAHQGRPHSDEDLRAVSQIYEAAYMARLPVQRAVADALGISLSAAAKRIMAARQNGFLTVNKRGE